jgi:predicted permease
LELMPNVINKIKQNSSDMNEIILAPCDVISKIKQNSSDMNEILLAPCDVISKIKQNSSDMNESILAPCDVISKIKQNSSDMNEIMLAPCDAGYVQSCTGFILIVLFKKKGFFVLPVRIDCGDILQRNLSHWWTI